MDHTPNSFSRFRAVFQSLSEREREVAKYIVDQPELVITSTLAKVSSACGVSETTVLRVCRHAGFEGFTDMKISIAKDMPPLTRTIGDDISLEDEPDLILQKVFQSNVQCLNDTIEICSKQDFTRAVEMLDSARHIMVVGVGPSGVLAQDLHYKLLRLGKSCSFETDSYNQLVRASMMGESDLLVCISVSGMSTDPIDTLDTARERNVRAICITGDATSYMATHSDAVLSVVSKREWIFMASRIAEFALLEALYLALSIRHFKDACETEDQIKSSLAKKIFTN
jgi:DNA-binding MurR/RpiR family transcriptional regulator